MPRLKSKPQSIDASSLRPINSIAIDIQKAWNNVNYAAKPYLDAMLSLQTIHSRYGADGCDSIITYFLCNASSFKGEQARALKQELKNHLNSN